MNDLHCPKCLTSRTGDALGQPCRSPGCTGTIEVDPPFSTLVENLPEPFFCLRRGESFSIPGREGPDFWQKFKSNGNRVCSYCGSLHPDDMFAMVQQCVLAPADAPYGSVVELDQSDKSYKIYVHQPGVRNAHEGGIKFYTHHLPRDENGKVSIPDERNEEFSLAIRASRQRFNQKLAAGF